MNLLKRTIEKTLHGFAFGVGMGFSFMVLPTNKQNLASRPAMWPDAAVATAVEQNYQPKEKKTFICPELRDPHRPRRCGVGS
jgi:hypothetical protein